MNLCLCGCGDTTQKDWCPGHDQIWIHRMIKDRFGTVKEFKRFMNVLEQLEPILGLDGRIKR